MSTTGRVAMVTGASRGIGRAVAQALLKGGDQVALGWSKDQAGAEQTAAELGGLPVRIDVTDAASVDAAFEAVEAELGKVGVLVNNAGVTADGLLLRMTEEQWSSVLRTNLDGVFHCIRRAAPAMVRARAGRIVTVGSVAGLLGSAGQVNYSAAKAGLVGLTRSVARELASRNVTCNLVTPGPISTAMLDPLPEERRAELAEQVPLGRLGTPGEVAAAVAFLCSDGAAYITGAIVPVDGGLGMGH